MGNAGQKSPHAQNFDSSDRAKQDTTSRRDVTMRSVRVNPQREGHSIEQDSMLKSHLPRRNILDNEESSGDNLRNYINELNKIENVEVQIKDIEQEVKNKFEKKGVDHIREDFESQSKEGKMSKKKLLEQFGMVELDNKQLGNRFFQASKSTFSQKKTGPQLDYSKFVKTVSMLGINNHEGRLRFLYSLFDVNLDGSIEKDEMQNILLMFMEAMTNIKQENLGLENLKNKIAESHERQIEIALEEIVNEIQDRQQTKRGALGYEEWRKWIQDQEGVKEVLEFDSNTQNPQNPVYN